MQSIVDNTDNKKKVEEPVEDNYIHRASFKQNLKQKSKNEIIDMTIDIWQKYDELQKAYRRMTEYTSTAINVIKGNGIAFPSVGEYYDLIKDDKKN